MRIVSGYFSLHAIVDGVNGTNGISYSIVSSIDSWHRRQDGSVSPSVLTWKYIISDGTEIKELTSLSDVLALGYTAKYQRDNGEITDVTGDFVMTIYAATESLVIYLYYGDVCVAQKTVAYAVDGTNGTDGADGADGEKGDSAEYYTIEAEVASVGFTNSGGYSPSSWRVSEYHVVGNSKTVSNANFMFIYGVKDGVRTYLTSSTNVQNYTFNASSYASSAYDAFIFELRASNSTSGTLIASTSVSVGKQGATGSPGTTGPRLEMVNWNDVAVGYQFYSGASGEAVYHIVTYNGLYYKCIKTHTKTSTTPLYDSTNWLGATVWPFIATDTALVDNATIAGLVFSKVGTDANGNPTGVLKSQGQNPNISWANNGAWSDDGGYRKSATISANGFTKEIITITATETSNVVITMVASSEAGWDRGYIGKLNTTYSDRSSIASNYLARVSGTESINIVLTIPSGTHTLEIIYTKDGSGDGNEDCVRYVVEAPTLMINGADGSIMCTNVNLSGVINATGGTFKNIDIESAFITGELVAESGNNRMAIIPSDGNMFPSIEWSNASVVFTKLGMYVSSYGYTAGMLELVDNGSTQGHCYAYPNRFEVGQGTAYTGRDILLSCETMPLITMSSRASGTFKEVHFGMENDGRMYIHSLVYYAESSATTGTVYVDGSGYLKVKNPSSITKI